MTQKFIFTLWGGLYLMFGINLLFIPNEFMTVFGCPLDLNGVLVGRVFGSTLIGLFVMYFKLRNIPENNSGIKPVILMSLIFNGLVAPVMTHATLTNLMNFLGWIPVLVNVIISATAIFLIYKERNKKI